MSPIRALSVPLLLFAAAPVLLPAGTRLHLAPDRTSESVAIVDESISHHRRSLISCHLIPCQA